MNQRMRGAVLGAWLALTLVCGYVLGGVLYDRHLSSRDLADRSDGGVHSDGWLQEQARVSFEGLGAFGNSLRIRLNPVRPAASGPLQVGFSVCGGAETVVAALDREPIGISLKGSCSPREVVMRGLDSTVVSEGGRERRISVQLLGATVTSRLGIPIVSLRDALTRSGALVIVGALILFIFRGSLLLGATAAGVAQICLVIGAAASGLGAEKLVPLWVVAVSLLAGVAVFSLGQEREESHDEARPAASTSSLIILSGIVLLAAALRFYGITFGLPANYHPDEVPKVNAIMRMVEQHTLNPQYFLHPSLLLYSSYAMNTVFHLFGMDGSFRETAFLAGRCVSFIAGVLSVVLTYQIGARLFSQKVGLAGAFLLAVFPLHITCSRYMKEDALLTFTILLSTWLTLVAVQSGRKWVLPFAGFVAGCSAGSKYSGILTVLIPLSAPWLASRRWIPDSSWFGVAIIAGLLAPCGFVVTTPYSVLDSARFLKGFRDESNHMQNGHTTSIDPWSQGWMYHMWRSITPGASFVATVVGLAGLGYLLRRWTIYSLFVVGVFVLFYLPAEYVKAKPAPQPERYILPCLPFLALAAGALFEHVARLWSSQRTQAVVFPCLALAVGLTPLVRSAELAREVRVDTRDTMAAWMQENLPKGSVVLMDWKPYCPRLDAEHFEVRHIPRAEIIPELDLRKLKASGADYLILSSLFYGRYFTQPETDPALRQRLREVFERVPVVTQFVAENGSYGFHNPVLTLFSLKADDFERLADERARKQRGEIALTSNEVRAQKRW